MQNNIGNLKLRLTVMSYLVYAVWGSYLCSLGVYLANIGMGADIGAFFAVQGIVSLFMPALVGIVADRWIPAQKCLGICQLLAALFMAAAGYIGYIHGNGLKFSQLFPMYAISVAFFMPTIALSNSVSYNALTKSGLDTVKVFPNIRVFGTVGFVISMWVVDLTGFKDTYMQLFVSAAWSVVLGLYAFTLPNCPVTHKRKSDSFTEMFGLQAFMLFRKRKMALFFIFSFLLGMCLQVTNGFASPFLASFGYDESLADSFAVKHNVILTSLSQVSETLCILLIPFFLKRYGIKTVMLISMLAWVLRFDLFGMGNPQMPGLILIVLSMVFYGIAFDFFNISGSLFVDRETDESIRSSAQGVFMLMTNGLGATIGSFCAQSIVNTYTHSASKVVMGEERFFTIGEWSTCWYIFAGFALIVAVMFAILFKNGNNTKTSE